MSIASNFPAIKPTLLLDFANTEELDPRITFTRASTGTFYNGVTTAKAEENLLTFSQEFDNAYWFPTNATVTANVTTAPDGTSTADTLADNATSGGHTLSVTTTGVSGSTYVFSVFAKANTRSILFMNAFDTAHRIAWFDLSAGTVGTVQAGVTASIVSVGNGWYRCTTIRTASAGTFFPLLGVSNADNVQGYVGNGSSIFLWGAQLEQRSAVSAYTATTTQPITNYIPVLQTAASGVARFEHNPTTFESLGLEIEESRTNLQVYSSEFDNAAWGKTNATITADTIVAPDGTLTGDKLVEDTATGEHAIGDGFVFTSGTTYTGTIYAKKAERTLCRFGAGSTATWPASIIVDLSNGTITSTVSGSGTVTDVGNGWYRISVTGTAAATASTNFGLRLVSTGTTISYTGNGYSGIYIWGAQLEAGAFATSYIPTVASQVTRAADAASMTGTNFSSWYNAAEGTVYAEAYGVDGSGGRIGWAMSDNSFNNSAYLLMPESTDSISLSVVNGGVGQVSIGPAAGTFVGGTFYKTASAVKFNDSALCVNAGTVSTDTSCTMPNRDRFFIGSNWTGNGNFLNGTIRKIAYYPLRVTNAQLSALTS